MSSKIYDEKKLREATRALAATKFEGKWGKLTDAAERTLDVTGNLEAWENGGREHNKTAFRLFSEWRGLLKRTTDFVEMLESNDLPMSRDAQLLARCVPDFAEAIAKMERTRMGPDINPAEEPNRSYWLIFRVQDLYYPGENALRDAPRAELAALGILGGWWPPAVAFNGQAVRTKGATPEGVLAAEGELQSKARNALLARDELTGELLTRVERARGRQTGK